MYNDTLNGSTEKRSSELPDAVGPIVQLQEKLYVPVKEYPDVSIYLSPYLHLVQEPDIYVLQQAHIVATNRKLSVLKMFFFCPALKDVHYLSKINNKRLPLKYIFTQQPLVKSS